LLGDLSGELFKACHNDPWSGLMEQMGSNYADVKDFRRRFNDGLEKVQRAWRGLRRYTIGKRTSYKTKCSSSTPKEKTHN
jgi:hypothetical protein